LGPESDQRCRSRNARRTCATYTQTVKVANSNGSNPSRIKRAGNGIDNWAGVNAATVCRITVEETTGDFSLGDITEGVDFSVLVDFKCRVDEDF
jgi:hypothetical protein